MPSGSEELDPARIARSRCNMLIGSQADAGVPAMWHHHDAVIVGILADAMLFGEPTHFRDIGLEVIDCPALNPG